MNKTEQLTVLAIVAWVAYLVGTSHGQKATGTKCAKCGANDTAATTDAPSSMDWFVNWGGLK